MHSSPFTVLAGCVVGVLNLGAPIRSAAAQTSWDRYKPGTLSAVMDQHDSSIRAGSVDRRPSWVVTGNQFPTLARVRYRGDSRPVDSIRLEIVRHWGVSFLRDSSIARAFHREYLFQEGNQSLWLPVQDSVARYFARELKPGQDVTLYVLWLGAYYAGKDITWAFIVTEFKAGTTQR
jgi:hypothetical protein